MTLVYQNGKTGAVKPCRHKWVFMESIKKHSYEGDYTTRWSRIDRFHCERCLELKEVAKQVYERDKPDWF